MLSLACKVCNKACDGAAAIISRKRNAAFCSLSCSSADAYREKTKGVVKLICCKVCKKEVSVDFLGRKYCDECQHFRSQEYADCSGCGKAMLKNKASVGFCSPCLLLRRAAGKAAMTAKLSDKQRTCRHCSAVFAPATFMQAFCSPTCNNRHWSQRKRNARRAAFVEDVSLSYIVERDGGICQICNEPVDSSLAFPDPLSASIDHILPLSRGGEHSKRNCQLAHFGCNCQKGHSGTGHQMLLIG